MSMFDVVKKSGTNGTSYGISTGDIVEMLERWDARYGLEIIEVERNRLCLAFHTLPEDIGTLAEEMYGICPEVLGEHAGGLEETIVAMERAGLAALTEGMDFAEQLGLDLLEETLRAKRTVALRWH